MKQCMDSENLHRRLAKILGQIKAIDRMIDEDIPCEEGQRCPGDAAASAARLREKGPEEEGKRDRRRSVPQC